MDGFHESNIPRVDTITKSATRGSLQGVKIYPSSKLVE